MTVPPLAWLYPPQSLALPDDEIHVWRAALDVDRQLFHTLQESIAPNERSRADRFVFSRDRDYFLTCRGILRKIIGMYLRLPPGQIAFQYGAQGKPTIGELNAPLRFNLSHSHGWAVYAFSHRREVGVDIERIQRDFACDEIAERYFSRSELSELRGFAAEFRTKAFFQGWTLKEAYVKARGLGLQIPFDTFSVTLAPYQPERLSSDDASRWQIISFEPAPEFVGAIVGEGRGWRPRYWTWLPQTHG